ncbi:prephenate dehydrogenase [Nonomuraea sp. NPDC005650]|uniref:prephenate dehydrogenase n=1 Tax=Nonomuraea sp. NPDC005650 TaxID=3157045 RepID=UPI0033AEA188
MRTAAVVGTGLIGTSVALALSRRGVAVHLSDADERAARTAASLGAGTLSPPDGPVDVAVLAVPPASTARELARWQREGLARAYTDVASVKTRPQREITRAGGDLTRYVGGHPMSGGERSGPLAGRVDLFERRYWILTPSADTEQDVLNTALELVSLCGGVPVVMGMADHDRAVALASHAPHVVAALMAGLLEDVTEDAVRICGQGLRDVTRIAGGDPELWGEILDANADAVADVLQLYAGDLARTIAALRALSGEDPADRRRGAAELESMLRRGTRGHARIPRKHHGPEPRYAEVDVVISDQPGVLARLLASADDVEVNIEDVRIEHALDEPSGRVRLLVSQDSASVLAQRLDADGWEVRT